MAVRGWCFSTPLTVLAAAAALAVGGVLAGGAAARDDALPTLTVAYTMNCTFSITDDNGARVSTLPPGTYQLQITTPIVFADTDLTGITDMTACKSFVQFQLAGPGVSVSTTLQDGDEDYGVFNATFKASSTYTAVDLNQPSVARVVFSTAASGSPTSPNGPVSSGSGTNSSGGKTGSAVGTPIAADPLRGTLAGAVSAAGALTLTTKGKAVTSLRSGRYTVVVSDRSGKNGFTLQGLKKGARALTGAAFTGRRSVTLDLKPGQWFFYSTFVGKKSYFIVTA